MRLVRYAEAMLDDSQFFVRKAIGWVLRETGRHRPEVVTGFLAPRTDRVSGVTLREAVKYLPRADRDRLLAAYAARRGRRPPAASRGSPPARPTRT